MKYYEMQARFDSRKSFYGKATILENENSKILCSYNTEICKIDKDTNDIEFYIFRESQTTTRHIKEFLKQNGLECPATISKIKERYNF